MAFEHTNHQAPSRVQHPVHQLWLRPAAAAPLFSGFGTRKLVTAEIVHNVHPAEGESLSTKVNICSERIGNASRCNWKTILGQYSRGAGRLGSAWHQSGRASLPRSGLSTSLVTGPECEKRPVAGLSCELVAGRNILAGRARTGDQRGSMTAPMRAAIAFRWRVECPLAGLRVRAS